MSKKFFITTPIYYPNAAPHIGTAYSILITDVIARYKRLDWYQVKFSTWLDENGQKMLNTAKEKWMDIMDFLDDIADQFITMWKWLDISYTDFIRTTEKRHFDFVQKVLKNTYESWDIFKWEYEGMYCVGCESFKKASDLTPDWLCPDHLKKPEFIKEKNYFFALSKYQNKLEEFYKNHPDFTIPNHRFKEMQTFLNEWLEDFSISRENANFGIPLPFDNSQVTYIWYDALFNYLTVCQDWDEDFWPVDLHLVGKEIARFHVINWPAMLMSAWYELPKNILVTWFLTVDWQKISKSLGNAINPLEFVQKYSRDLMLLYLLSSFPIWQDWDFSEEQAVFTYNARLANNIGNLLNRFLVLSLKIGGKIDWILDSEIWLKVKSMITNYEKSMNNYNLKDALDLVFELWNDLNKYLDDTKPWNLKDESNLEELTNILYTLGEWLRVMATCLYPFFYEKMWELLVRIGVDYWDLFTNKTSLQELISRKEIFVVSEKWEALYPRI